MGVQGKRLAVGIVLLGVAVFGACGCSSVSYNSSPSAPGLAVVQVRDLGTIPTNPDILGRDGGYSTVFQENSVWVYGDTFLAQPNAQNFGLISDSWSYTPDLNAQQGLTDFKEPTDAVGAPTMILPLTATELAFNEAHNGDNCLQPCGARWALWPASIVVDPGTNQALIFYQLISAQPGDFNFKGVGSSVATWQSLTSQPQRPVLNPPIVPAHPDLMFTSQEVAFGSAAMIAGGMLYVYGCDNPGNGFDKGCRLGRVAPAQVQNRSAWTYYAGNGNWSARDTDAISVFTGDSILSVAWNSFLHDYVAVYSAQFSQNVMVRTSPNPEGPWSDEIVAFVAKAPESGNVYDAHAHPEYDVNGGQTFFVTYSRATGAFSSEVRLVSVAIQAASQP
jgi:hypothetical protein